MGNYRFRFSNMMPNAWFYKLKDMNKSPKHYNKKKPAPTSQKPHNPKPRCFPSEPFKPGSRLLHPIQASAEPPSIKRRDRRRTVYKPSPRVISSTHHHSSLSPFQSSSPEPPESLLSDSDDDDDDDDEFFNSNSYKCQLSSSANDIIIDMEHNTMQFDNVHGFDSISQLDLPPILTKLSKSNHREPSPRKSFGTSHGIKIRSNSPKIASKKIQACARKSLSPCNYLKSRNMSIAESFAVVKSSFDPERDFRDSMVEMIVENNIRSSKELEDLLACYLSLNSNEYHDLIIKAFEQIWLDMTNLRL